MGAYSRGGGLNRGLSVYIFYVSPDFFCARMKANIFDQYKVTVVYLLRMLSDFEGYA